MNMVAILGWVTCHFFGAKMKLFEILNESRVRQFNVTDISAILERECSQSLKQWEKTPLYRGGDFENIKSGMGFGESIAETPRKSANTANFYTLWIDNSKLWDGMPKRSKSFIGATARYISSGYGDVALMIPFDSAKIGVCPDDDLWASFNLPYGESLDGLNAFCVRAMDLVNGPDNSHPETYAELKKVFSKIEFEDIIEAAQEVISSKSPNPLLSRQAKSMLNDLLTGKAGGKRLLNPGESLADMMDKFLHPTDFKLFNGTNFKAPTSKEVFIEGKCVFIIPHLMSKWDKDRLFDEFEPYERFMEEIYGN